MDRQKHAYLIIAHNEFEVLQKLIAALDDERNSIYVHIDKKVKQIPVLAVSNARLFILNKRIDVRWGHVSQIETEYALFETALESAEQYSRYHLISGTHMPLKTQDEIHDFFTPFQNREVLNFLYTNPFEIRFKLHRYHFFLRNYRNESPFVQKTVHLVWHILLKLQSRLGIEKTRIDVHNKANNWLSLTSVAVAYIVKEKESVLKKFRYTLCGDEYFVPHLLHLRQNEFKVEDKKELLFNEFVGSFPRTLTKEDYDFLIHSEFLFARKFTEKHMEVVDQILTHISSKSIKPS